MAATPGRKAFVYASTTSTSIAGKKIAKLDNFNFTVNEEPIDITNHDSSGWKATLAGIRNASFTAETFEPTTGAVLIDIRAALTGASTLFIAVGLTTSTSAKKWTGWGRITTLGYGAPTAGALVKNIAGEFTGALTYTS